MEVSKKRRRIEIMIRYLQRRRDNYDFRAWQQWGRIKALAVSAKSLFQNALFCILLSQEKKGWILYQITSGYYKGEDYDLILGPMANDDVYRTFTLYTAGILTKEQALEQLKIKKLYDQLVLTSVKALSYLRFVGTVPEEEF